MSDKNYVLTNCPECSTEHRVHKGRVSNSLIKCKKCKCLFFVTKQSTKETAFMQAFGGSRK